MVGPYSRLKNILGLTLIEALVSVVIVGIGFVSIFQMVNYSIRSIDVSGERTKTNFLVSMVAEDLMADKEQEYNKKKFHEHLLNTSNKGWEWELVRVEQAQIQILTTHLKIKCKNGIIVFQKKELNVKDLMTKKYLKFLISVIVL